MNGKLFDSYIQELNEMTMGQLRVRRHELDPYRKDWSARAADQRTKLHLIDVEIAARETKMTNGIEHQPKTLREKGIDREVELLRVHACIVRSHERDDRKQSQRQDILDEIPNAGSAQDEHH